MININSPNIQDLGDVTDIVNEENKHLVFLDACAFLDIVRVPLPERNNDLDLHTHLIEVKNLIVNDEIISISSELCVKEFNDNISEVIPFYKSQIDKMEKPLNGFIENVNKSGISGYPITKSDLKSYSLESYFSDIAEAVINKVIFIKEEECFRNLAHSRVIDKTPPAHKKGEYKDCLIWETFLSLLKNRSSFEKYNFFLSSNKRDYCELPDVNQLHPFLIDETETYNCHFALTDSRLYHRLREFGVI